MTYSLDKIKLLVIDDMQPMLSLTKGILEEFGFQNVFTAEDGATGFEMVCEHDPDLVLTDWIMEPLDGLEFTRMVRKSKRVPNPYVPIIMMTGFSSRLRVEAARDTGITEFLVKPFNAKHLYARIHHIIEKPRQFVDTGEFFGPDRRRRSEDDYEGAGRRENDPITENEDKQNQNTARDILKQLREEAKNI